jgi:hypothetical protein
MKKPFLMIFLIVFCFEAAGFAKSGAGCFVNCSVSINQDVAELVKKHLNKSETVHILRQTI